MAAIACIFLLLMVMVAQIVTGNEADFREIKVYLANTIILTAGLVVAKVKGTTRRPLLPASFPTLLEIFEGGETSSGERFKYLQS